MLFTSVSAKEVTETKLIYRELDQVNARNKTLIINGKQYKYKKDQAISAYRSEFDTDKSLTLRALHEGNKYYFNLQKDVRKKEFTTVIFIASEKPAE